MAADHSTPSSPAEPPALNWQEGSSSGEWSSKGGSQPKNIILPTVALHPSAWLHTTQISNLAHQDPPNYDTNTVTTESWVMQSQELSSETVTQGHMHKLARVPQVHNPVTVNTKQASSRSTAFLSTVVPNIDVESTARGAPNPLAHMSSSASDRGETLTAHHVELQKMSWEEPTNPSQHVADLQASSQSLSLIDGDPPLGLRLREHAWSVADGAAQHTITLRDVHAANESPTNGVVASTEKPAPSVESPAENQTSSLALSTDLNPVTQMHTVTNNHTVPDETTSKQAEAQVANGNNTDHRHLGHWLGNVTTPGGLLPNSSSLEEAPVQGGNSSEAPSTASRTFLNRQVPTTTHDPLATGNSSGPTVDSPPSRMTICLSRMDIVWIVLAISVPVSSCSHLPVTCFPET
uniref:Uncharacterized protein n=1 Tax=Echeneis naucrates TaxID=173247 RepID=A0A665TB00_ECHNA